MKQKLNLIADCAPTPRYVTADSSMPSFNYVIVGGGKSGLKTAEILSASYPKKLILIIEATKSDESLRVLPLNVSLRNEQNELVNRSLTEWTAQLLQLPVMPQYPTLISSGSGMSKRTPLLYLDDKKTTVIDDARAHDICQSDIEFWRNTVKFGHLEDHASQDEKSITSFIQILNARPNVKFLLGTDVTMINYKQQIIGTRKLRVRFQDAVYYAASLKNLIPDISRSGDAQPAVRFYPPLSTDVLKGTHKLNYVSIERTQLSFNEPFWQKRRVKDAFYFIVPSYLKQGKNSIVRATCCRDGRSLEICYTPQAKCCTRRIGKNIFDETYLILQALGSLFQVVFSADDKLTHAHPQNNHVVTLIGVRHLSCKSSYVKSIMVEPDYVPLFDAMRSFSRNDAKNKLVFVHAEDDKDLVKVPRTSESSSISEGPIRSMSVLSEGAEQSICV